MELPAPPRSGQEVAFYAAESPCERCGKLGLTLIDPNYRKGVYTATCAHCGLEREFRFPPVATDAPGRGLAPGDAPSRLIDADRFAAIAARELVRVPDEPLDITTVSAYQEARGHLNRAIVALTELAKHRPGDAEVARRRDEALARWERYRGAQAEIEAKPGAQPTPQGLDDRFRQHRAWLERGRRGDGRMVFQRESWSGHGMSTPMLDAAIIEDTRFTGIDFSYGHFNEVEGRRSQLVDCNLAFSEFDRATLEACDLAGSRLSLADLRDVTITGGDWHGIVAGRSTWRGKLTGVDLHEAQLRDTVLDDTVFERCDLRKADLSRRDPYLDALGTARRTRFVECDLRDALIDGWRLDGTVFERCRMHGLVARPVLEGAIQVIDCDFSPAGDGGADAVGGARLVAAWRGDGRPSLTQPLEEALGHAGPLLAVWDDASKPEALLIYSLASGHPEQLAVDRDPRRDKAAVVAELVRRGIRQGSSYGSSEFVWSSDSGFTVWSLSGVVAEGGDLGLRLPGGRHVRKGDVTRVISFLDRNSLGHRGIKLALAAGGEAVVAEEHDAAAELDPTYGLDNVAIDGAWATFGGRDLARWLGVPHTSEVP